MIDTIKPHEIADAEQGIQRREQRRLEHLHEAQRLTNEISHMKVLVGRAYREKKTQRYPDSDTWDWLK